MKKHRKEITAGRYHIVATYPVLSRWDKPKERAEKKFHTSKAQQQVNDKNSRVALTALIAENFADSETALFVTPSFDDAHYPEYTKDSDCWKFCIKEAALYMKRLRILALKRSQTLKYVYSVGVGKGGRWHFHALIDGVTAEDVRDAWGRGAVDYHSLYSDSKWITDREWNTHTNNVNPAAIAKYMMGNAATARRVGDHYWHASRSCTRPTVKTTIITERESIESPAGAEVLDRETSELVYSTYQFIEYIEPRPKRRPKRKGSRAAGRLSRKQKTE